jgi:hypothetical protein
MRRSKLSLLVLPIAAFIVWSCGESPSVVAPSATRSTGTRAAAITAGTCTDLAGLTALVDAAFGAGSPDANSAQGKVNNLNHKVVNLNDIPAAQEQAFNLVSFILKKNKQSPLPGGSAAVVSLVNAVFCFSGLSITITDPANTTLIFPSDAPQQLIHTSGLAGTQLDTNPVSEPTLLTITPITGVYPPGAGPLSTKLDQYPGFFLFEKVSATGAPLTKPVVVAVCLSQSVPVSVFNRLRLGHGASYGFEITPPASAAFLNCPTAPPSAQSGTPGLLRTVANLFLPKALHASMQEEEAFTRGGVGGTAGEYSPFDAVDPELSFRGGVGGTAGEYIRSPRDPRRELPSIGLPELNSKGASLIQSADVVACSTLGLEAPIGTPIDPACQPGVKLQTRLGTLLSGVPVNWAVTAGGGTIAPAPLGSCGASGSTAQTTTNTSGKAAVCWTMGLTPGANTVVATPSVGGDAPAGVTFNPSTFTFNATANPPSALVYDIQPATGANIVAGVNIPVRVRAVDHNGVTVLGSSDVVSLALNQNTFMGGSATATATAVAGVATFSGVAITKAASGYVMTAGATFFGNPVSTAGNSFNIVAAAGFGLSITQGNNQVAAAGSVVPIAPTVLVRDAYGNNVSGASIAWTPAASTISASPTPTSTDATGTTSTSWTIGGGLNQLVATLSRATLGDTSVVFEATGNEALGILNECLPGGSGDPINDPSKSYAFWIPNPGNNKTMRQIQLYFSSAGSANKPTPVRIQLTTQMGSFDPAVAANNTVSTTLLLRGNNSELKMGTFVLPTPIVGSGGGPKVMVKLSVLDNPDGAKINFNSGLCSPGGNCKVPPACNATEVSPLTPFPAGTTYRKSVGIIVRGG